MAATRSAAAANTSRSCGRTRVPGSGLNGCGAFLATATPEGDARTLGAGARKVVEVDVGAPIALFEFGCRVGGDACAVGAVAM